VYRCLYPEGGKFIIWSEWLWVLSSLPSTASLWIQVQ
jgi:hypothetical protein